MKSFLQRLRSLPLSVKVLLPLIAFVILCLFIIVCASKTSYQKRLTEYALERSRQLAHSIGVGAQIIHYPYELQRLVYAIGSEAHIRTLAILYGDPLTVLASTRNTLVGKTWKTYPLPKGVRLPNFPQEQEAYDSIPERYIFNYVLGFYLLRYENTANYVPAYIVVQSDTYFWSKEFLKQELNMVFLSFIILLVIIFICWAQIHHWVIKPLTAIKRQMNKRRLGNIFAMSPVFCHDEIGDLSETLNGMIHSQEKTENLFQNLVNIAPVLLWTSNEDNTKFYFNEQWCAFTGQKKLHYDDWSWLKYLSPEIAQYYKTSFLTAQRLRQSASFECQINDHEGQLHWMLCQSVPRFLKNGRFEGYISCLVDITERKDNEEKLSNYAQELAKARDEAVESAQMKSTFLATMSHEIRTPINGILGFSYLLQDTKLTKEQRDYAKTISSSTQILLDLINQILDLSKIEAKKLTLETTNFNLDAFLKGICNIFQPTLTKKQIELNIWTHPQVQRWLYGDEKRLRQVLLNLLSNAIKFTQGGTVYLRITGCQRNDHYLLFVSVKDQGVGISPKDKKRIFDAFEQVPYQNKGGTGLGLPIAQSLVQLMGGTLSVHSQLQMGSIFYFTVLLQPGKEVLEPEPQLFEIEPTLNEHGPKHTYKMPLLLVEDNLENQRLAQKILEKSDFSVQVVSNGIQCLDWFSCNEAMLIVMDINMPQMDGFETTQRIRSGQCGLEKAAIPIIGLTASALPETQDRAKWVGMNDVLTKPFQPEMLLQTIKKYEKH